MMQAMDIWLVLFHLENQCDGSRTFWCRSGSGYLFSYWCGSGSGSGSKSGFKILLDGKRIKKFFKSSTIFSKIFQNLSCQIFSVTMREEGWGLRPSTWGIRCEGWGRREVVWGRRCERSSVKEEGRGGGSELVSDLDPDPAIWCRSFGSGSATLSQSINILQSHKKLQPGNYRHHTCPFLTKGARHRRKIYQSLFGGQIPCRASYFASVVLEE